MLMLVVNNPLAPKGIVNVAVINVGLLTVSSIVNGSAFETAHEPIEEFRVILVIVRATHEPASWERLNVAWKVPCVFEIDVGNEIGETAKQVSSALAKPKDKTVSVRNATSENNFV